MRKLFNLTVILVMVFGVISCQDQDKRQIKKGIKSLDTIEEVQSRLFENSSELDKDRIIMGVGQLAESWRIEDGSVNEFKDFCIANFLTGDELRSNFERICRNMESLNGHSSLIRFSFNESARFTDVNELEADSFFRNSIPSADAYDSKLAFFIKLNYPHYTLEQKRTFGEKWSREKWAMVALGDSYKNRRDPDFENAAVEAAAAFGKYMQHYFLRMDHVCLEDGTFPFPSGALLHSHRGLRDNCKEEYTRPDGYDRQRLTGIVLEHILKGTVPEQFLEDSTTRWNPWANELYYDKEGKKEQIEIILEGPVRYEGFRSVFLKRSSEDILYPEGSTVITRTFENQNLQISEIEKLLRDLLSDPVIAKAGKLIESRLGRPLEPFDIWYSGFQEQSFYSADMLDSITINRYPDPLTLQNGLPKILINMGFSKSEAEHLGAHTTIRPVVSGGATSSPPMRGGNAVSTTMFTPSGLDYKAYRVVMHELGHAVCAIYSTDEIDNFIMAGWPTNGITEAMAELLAYKNVQGLGLSVSSADIRENNLALATLWYLVEMGGQSLTDIETWKWIYQNPDASGIEVQDAVLSITENIWNTYFAEIFNGIKDQHILSIYNHFIGGSLYLHQYFLGNVIMFQLHEASRSQDLATFLKTACKEGNTLPDLWMEKAVGSPVSLDPLVSASNKAIEYFNKE